MAGRSGPTSGGGMAERLPPALREWVRLRARAMGLPGPDDYLLLLLRLDKQEHDVAAALGEGS